MYPGFMRILRSCRVASRVLLFAVAIGFVGCSDDQVALELNVPPPTASETAGASTLQALGELVVRSLRVGSLKTMVVGGLRMQDGAELRSRFERGGFHLEPEHWDVVAHDREHKLMATWRDVRTYGELAGFDWSDIRVEKVTAGRRQAWMGVTTTDVAITITAHGGVYEIQADDCMRLSRGWVVGDGLRWMVDGSKGLPTRRAQAGHPPHNHSLETKHGSDGDVDPH